MSLILGIDSSSTDLSVGLYRENAPVASFARYIGSSHAEHIAPVIELMLRTNSHGPDEIDRIAVATGPGSFTGLRIGIAFVKGICIAHPVPVLPVSSLFVLAHAGQHHDGRIIAAIDARNNDVYWAVFSRRNGHLERHAEDRVTPSGQFTAALEKGDLIVTDTIGYRKSTVFTALPEYCATLSVEDHPQQRGLLCAASGVRAEHDESRWQLPVDIHPNYLRRSAPEERLNARKGT